METDRQSIVIEGISERWQSAHPHGLVRSCALLLLLTLQRVERKEDQSRESGSGRVFDARFGTAVWAQVKRVYGPNIGYRLAAPPTTTTS